MLLPDLDGCYWAISVHENTHESVKKWCGWQSSLHPRNRRCRWRTGVWQWAALLSSSVTALMITSEKRYLHRILNRLFSASQIPESSFWPSILMPNAKNPDLLMTRLSCRTYRTIQSRYSSLNVAAISRGIHLAYNERSWSSIPVYGADSSLPVVVRRFRHDRAEYAVPVERRLW